MCDDAAALPSAASAGVEDVASAAAAGAAEESAPKVGLASTVEKLVQSKNIMDSIRELKEQQAKLRKERKDIAKKLRNEEKRRVRLKRKARQLTDGDLVSLLRMRSDEAASAASSAAAASAGPVV